MNKEEYNKIIDELKAKSEIYQHEVELKVLDNCPFIVEVGALTIETDETGNVITQNTNYPTQFTQKAVDEILSMNFMNGIGEKIIPRVYGRNEWYLTRLNDVNETIKLLKKNFTEVI